MIISVWALASKQIWSQVLPVYPLDKSQLLWGSTSLSCKMMAKNLTCEWMWKSKITWIAPCSVLGSRHALCLCTYHLFYLECYHSPSPLGKSFLPVKSQSIIHLPLRKSFLPIMTQGIISPHTIISLIQLVAPFPVLVQEFVLSSIIVLTISNYNYLLSFFLKEDW